MSRSVPAATATLRVLRYLSGVASPATAVAIAAAVDLPRSSAYHLLAAMADEGFVTHYRDDGRWGLGVAAYEVGVGYARQEPVARLARIPMARLVDAVGESAHLVMLHGREVVYVLEERAPGRPPLVTDVGVRLPAHLTASGRAVLATLPATQVRALFPDQASFSDRTGLGPTTPTALRDLLVDTRRRGYAVEAGEVTTGFSSIAVPIVAGQVGPTLASVAITYSGEADPVSLRRMYTASRATAAQIATRLTGRRH